MEDVRIASALKRKEDTEKKVADKKREGIGVGNLLVDLSRLCNLRLFYFNEESLVETLMIFRYGSFITVNIRHNVGYSTKHEDLHKITATFGNIEVLSCFCDPDLKISDCTVYRAGKWVEYARNHLRRIKEAKAVEEVKKLEAEIEAIEANFEPLDEAG